MHLCQGSFPKLMKSVCYLLDLELLFPNFKIFGTSNLRILLQMAEFSDILNGLGRVQSVWRKWIVLRNKAISSENTEITSKNVEVFSTTVCWKGKKTPHIQFSPGARQLCRFGRVYLLYCHFSTFKRYNDNWWFCLDRNSDELWYYHRCMFILHIYRSFSRQ